MNNAGTIKIRSGLLGRRDEWEIRVLLDGKKIGNMAYGDEQSFEVEPGKHSVQLNLKQVRTLFNQMPSISPYALLFITNDVSVAVEPNGLAELECGIIPKHPIESILLYTSLLLVLPIIYFELILMRLMDVTAILATVTLCFICNGAFLYLAVALSKIRYHLKQISPAGADDSTVAKIHPKIVLGTLFFDLVFISMLMIPFMAIKQAGANTADAFLSNLYVASGKRLKGTNPAGSLKLYRIALFADPSSYRAREGINQLIWELDTNPFNWRNRKELGDEAASAKDFVGASVEYKEALRLYKDPDTEKKLTALPVPRDLQEFASPALIWRVIALPSASLGAWKNFMQTEPEAYANFLRGEQYAQTEQYDKAIDFYSAAIKVHPKNSLAYYDRGIAYDSLGQYQKAIDDYNTALELDPKFDTIYYNRGNAYDGMGQYEKAIADFSQVIELDPKYGFAYNNRGYASYKLGQYQKAIDNYSQAIDVTHSVTLPKNM